METSIVVSHLNQGEDLYTRVARPFYEPEIVVDMPLLSAISSKVPKGYYRLGMIHVPQAGLQPLPRGMTFVKVGELPAEGQHYIAAMDDIQKRYWVLAKVFPQPGAAMPKMSPKDLVELVKGMM